jgi:hypothetical protein
MSSESKPMPSERSVYRKVQEILEIARSVRVGSAKELREEIENTPPEIFRTLQYDPAIDQMVRRVSPRVIRQAVRMCQLLGMISSDGSLTDLGRQALRRRQFDRVVADRVRVLLAENGVDLMHLNRVITKGFGKKPPILPTCTELWEAGGGETPRGLFTRLLTLLSHCGGADSSQRKIYLHISTD